MRKGSPGKQSPVPRLARKAIAASPPLTRIGRCDYLPSAARGPASAHLGQPFGESRAWCAHLLFREDCPARMSPADHTGSRQAGPHSCSGSRNFMATASLARNMRRSRLRPQTDPCPPPPRFVWSGQRWSATPCHEPQMAPSHARASRRSGLEAPSDSGALFAGESAGPLPGDSAPVSHTAP